MSYRLVIAEKPSVGAAYAKVLGATNRQDGYWEGNGYLVSWCIGHLVELAPPNVYDEKYVKWSVADLPILPERWQYLVSASTKKQFGILKKLMNSPDVDNIVNSCDSGREGELIFRTGLPADRVQKVRFPPVAVQHGGKRHSGGLRQSETVN